MPLTRTFRHDISRYLIMTRQEEAITPRAMISYFSQDEKRRSFHLFLAASAIFIRALLRDISMMIISRVRLDFSFCLSTNSGLLHASISHIAERILKKMPHIYAYDEIRHDGQ